MISTCRTCSREFAHPPGRRRVNCSIDCYKEERAKRIEARTCPTCQGSFRIAESQAKVYCSGACADRAPLKRRTAECQRCHRSFTYPSCQDNASPRRYCSADCYNEVRQKDAWAAVDCARCNKPFRFLKSQHDRRFCSLECARKISVRRISGEKIDSNRTPPKRSPRGCLQCGQQFRFDRYDAARRFCTRSCWYTWRKLNKPAASSVRACIVCGAGFVYLERWKRPGVACSRACWAVYIAAQHRGEDHPNWRGGHTHNYGPSWDGQRRRARQRDKVCQDCGRGPQDLGQALDVHHVRRFLDFGLDRHKEANDLSNLICFCRSCHLRLEAREHNPNPKSRRTNRPTPA